MNSFGIQDAQVWKVCAIFFVFGHCRSSWRKKQNLSQKKTCKKYTILVFCARAPRMSFDNKLHTPCAPEHLGCQKNSYVFEFSCYFISNLLFTSVQINCFSLPRAPGMSKQHENLHTHWAHEYLRSHKILDFLDFFAFFSGRSKLFDRTVTA